MNMCDNAVATDKWPYVKICRSTTGTRYRLIVVGYRAGTHDPILESHDLCIKCAVTIEGPDPDVPSCPYCHARPRFQVMLVNQLHDFRCEVCLKHWNYEHVDESTKGYQGA